MPDYVRVREGKWEITIPTHRVTDDTKVLANKPAVASNGKPLAPKPVTSLGTPRAGSKQARKRAAKKTAASKAAAPTASGADGPGVDAGQTSATPEMEN